MRPAVDGPLQDEGLRFAEVPNGVVFDPAYLGRIERFLTRYSALTRDQLIGSTTDWRVLLNPQTRPDFLPSFERAAALCSSSSYLTEVMPEVVDFVVPLEQPRPRGWTCHYFRGAVFLGFPQAYSVLDLALDYVHEIGHQVLAVFQSVDPLIAGDRFAPVYSEVRRTMRPAIQSLQALSAIAFMTHLANSVGERHYRHPEFPYSLRAAHEHAIRHLRSSCSFTEVGAVIMNDFEAMLL
jgi:hypothetical protein